MNIEKETYHKTNENINVGGNNGGSNFESRHAERRVPEKKQFIRRRKVCPFAGPNAPQIDYKDVKVLMKFISERGKIMPSRITSVSTKKQKELSLAIKRARYLALMPFANL